MSSNKKKSLKAKAKSKTGSEEGRLYEKISLLLIAKRGYELSKIDNSKFHQFAIGREVDIGKDGKFDDVVFSYTDQDNVNNLIFVQIKHKQDDYQIDSQVLSTEATTAKNVGGSDGGMCRDFNLQKYFVSYLSVREELKRTKSKDLMNGKIKHVAIFTNISLNTEELNDNGFHLIEAPVDIVSLFTSWSKTPDSNNCYQLGDISEDLRKMLKKSSDLHRLAKELAKYVVWKDHRENKIMGIDETPIKHYHVALKRQIIQQSEQVEKNSKNAPYQEAQFTDDFLDCEKNGANQELFHALLEAVRELDESKQAASNEELKIILKKAKWKIVPNFGKSKQNIKRSLPYEWVTVKDDDIAHFLKCLVLIVNQPRVTELEALYKSSIERVIVKNTSCKQFLDKINNTGPEFRHCIEKAFGTDRKQNYKEKWISGDQIESFIDEKKYLVSITFVVNAMNLIYRNELMQYGQFSDCGKITEIIDNFLESNCKVLCINSPETLLSSIKLLQYFNRENDFNEENYRIFVNLDVLNSAENRDSVLKTFELERNTLLTIECNFAAKELVVDEFFYKIIDIAKRNSSNKIILITQEENCAIFTENIQTLFDDKKLYVQKNDSIHLKYFEPKEDPLQKNILVFQEHKEKICLANITGIGSWNFYVKNLPQGTTEQGIIDVKTLVKILKNEELDVGSKPLGSSSLDGAYANILEEIDVETLANKLMSQEQETEKNDVYIISGIRESSKKGKIDKLIQFLRLDNNKQKIENQLHSSVSSGKIEITDDKFKDEDFRKVCHDYPEKRVFWFLVKGDDHVKKVYLQTSYNPNFYLKRKFKNVIIGKGLINYIIQNDISELYIFYCVKDRQELYKSLELNKFEIKQLENNSKIELFTQKTKAEAEFKKISKQNETVHLLEFEEEQFVWHNSEGSVKVLQQFADQKQNEVSLVEEEKLTEKIKGRKVVIFADEPGMGKTTTLLHLYEQERETSSIIQSHWVIEIKLRDHLQAVGNIDVIKGIETASVIDFLSNIDLNLNNNLSKHLLAMALDKSKNFLKPLLLAFDGFDEVLDEDYRNRIVLLLKFLKSETAAKIWITARCHYKNILEDELSTIAVEFVQLDENQKHRYVRKYLQYRLHFVLNEKTFTELFTNSHEINKNKRVLIYTQAFLNKMGLIFRGNISNFIGTPLQLYLMLEGSERHFKNWILSSDDEIPAFEYVGEDVCEIYENFMARKYDVYVWKTEIRQCVLQRQVKTLIAKCHKKFAESKILEEGTSKYLDDFQDVFLLAGVIKFQGSHLEFLHKTFEEFFAAKAFIDWITKGRRKFSDPDREDYILKVIFKKPDYQLIRTFMNLMLKRVKHVPYKSLKYYGDIAEKLVDEEESPWTDENGTPLHVSVREGNKDIISFLLNILKGHPDVLEDFLFALDKENNTALHLACEGDDVEIVRVLLVAAKNISEYTLQEFYKYLNGNKRNALQVAVTKSHNVEILKELLTRASNKLDFLMSRENPLALASRYDKVDFVEFLLQEFNHPSAAKSVNNDRETVKKLLFPCKGPLPFYSAIYNENFRVVQAIINFAKNLDDDHYILKQLLLNDRRTESALHVAAKRGVVKINQLLLKTAADLGIEMLEKFLFALNGEGKDAIAVMFDRGRERTFDNSFEILLEDKYQNIREKLMEMRDRMPLESKLCPDKRSLIQEIECNNIKKVKTILSNARKSSAYPDETLRILLLAVDYSYDGEKTALRIACERGRAEIISELLSHALSINDGGATLKKMLKPKNIISKSPFDVLRNGYTYETELVVRRLVNEARNNKQEQVARFLEKVNEKYTAQKSLSRKYIRWSECSEESNLEMSDVEKTNCSSDKSDKRPDESNLEKISPNVQKIDCSSENSGIREIVPKQRSKSFKKKFWFPIRKLFKKS